MKRLRIGKDFGLSWKIKAKNVGENAPYTPSSDSVLLLVTPYNKVKAEGATFDGDTVRWIFRGKDQKHLGVYGLELVENQGENGMITIDTCEAFELVAHSCEETGHDGESLIFDTLEFITDVELNALRGPQGPPGPGAATPDWAAQEDEEGYIKNRTHYGIYTEHIDSVGEDWVELLKGFNINWIESFEFHIHAFSYFIGETANFAVSTSDISYEKNKPIILEHEIGYPRKNTLFLGVYYDEAENTLYGIFGDGNIEGWGASVDVGLKTPEYKQIGAAYIPDSIARVGDVEESINEVLDETEALWENVDKIDEEISNLSKKIDNLPSGDSSVFAAVWGETSYEEVKSAFEARKNCTCVYNNIIYNATSMASNGEIQFVATTLTSHFRLSCYSDGEWSKPTAFELERANNKTQSISDKSTDMQYPSAKAVYDLVQDSIINALNADYGEE